MDVLWILPFEDKYMSLDLVGYRVQPYTRGPVGSYTGAITPCCLVRFEWRHRADTFFIIFCSASQNLCFRYRRLGIDR